MGVPAMLRVVERDARVFRTLWRGTVTTSVVTPLLFLGAIGLGLGGLVDERTGDVEGVRYLEFVTPGLLAAGAMQTGAASGLWNVMAGTKWIRTFHAMVATPISAGDVLGGFLIWTALRTAIGVILFVLVAAAFGGVPSPWGVLAVPAAVLTAAAFTAPLAAFAATQDTDLAFSVILRLGVLPLFLFSGTFFPVSQLPDAVEPLAWLSPLWHGVELARAATTATVDWPAAALHVTVLLSCVAAGSWWGLRTFTRRLAP